MASGDDAVRVVDRSELESQSSVVQVENEEKGSFLSYFMGSKSKPEESTKKEDSTKTPPPVAAEGSHNPEVVHDEGNVRTTYDVEEDVPPSYLEQLKRKAHWNGR